MRLIMGWVAGLVFLMCSGACCGVGMPEFVTSSPDGACQYFDCDLMVGGTVSGRVVTFEAATGEVTAVSIEPAELADLGLDNGRIIVKPRRVGEGVLAVTLASYEPMKLPIRTAVLATTEVVPDRSIEGLQRVDPPGRKQMFEGSTLRVVAEHRDAAGLRLLGHGFEAWTISGGTLVEPVTDADSDLDAALVRDVVASGGPLITVGARAGGTPLELEVVPAGSTATLELENGFTIVRGGELAVAAGARFYVPVHAFSADGRFIHGLPPGGVLTATVTDATVMMVVADTAQRTLRMQGVAPGTTELTVAFDGASATFSVRVTEPTTY
ncbi:MAG: hypothetical protein JWP01_1440 [Myxococcales bacterium]|nr:hypothetical protein [Myxococcales bacterium]